MIRPLPGPFGGDAGFAEFFEHAPIGMAVVDLAGRRVAANDALCRLTGLSRDQLIGGTVAAITHEDDRNRDAENRQKLIHGVIPAYQFEKRIIHAWGHEVWVLATMSLIRGDDGTPKYLVSQVLDISKRKATERRLEALVDYDHLTGLYNRRRFEEEVDRELRRIARYGSPGTLLLIDLDHFKDVNDRFGHAAGDALLRTVAAALGHRVRQTDVLARIGGDEFAVILPHTTADHGRHLAEGIVRTLSRQAAVHGDSVINVSASVGVMPFVDVTVVQMMECVDRAMYAAKRAGGGTVATFPLADCPPRRDGPLLDRARIQHRLDHSTLLLYCQPIVDLVSHEASQFELLLRIDEDGSAAPPSVFLRAAEQAGLIQAVDSWVISRAIELLAKHARAGRRLVLNVNISATSACDPTFAATIESTLAMSGSDPRNLVLELTESAAVANLDAALEFMNRLRRIGCQFALDDFGAGFGSFFYLKHLPFDLLKIDGEFVRNVVAGPIDRLVVKAVVDVARGMKKRTVAEFVEDADAARLLRESGVDYGQGYYLGMPQPVEALLDA